jgi:hypothetical protein
LFSIIFVCNSCHRGVTASYWGLPFSALDSPSHATEVLQLVTEGCRFCSCFTITGHRGVAASHWGLMVSVDGFCSCFTITGHRGVAASHWGLLVSALDSPSQATSMITCIPFCCSYYVWILGWHKLFCLLEFLLYLF